MTRAVRREHGDRGTIASCTASAKICAKRLAQRTASPQ
jgi:hypothetical protein